MPKPPAAPCVCVGPPTQSAQRPFPALYVAADSPAPAASASEAYAGHDVTFTSPRLAICRVGGRPEHTPRPGHSPGWEKTREMLASACLCPGTRGHQPLNATRVMWPSAWITVGGQNGFSRAAAAASHRFRVKTSVAYYPNRGNRSSQPPIIQQRVSAKSASSPRPSTASLCPCGASSVQGLRGRGACDGRRSVQASSSTAAGSGVVTARAAHEGVSARWTEKTPAPGLAAGGRAMRGALDGPACHRGRPSSPGCRPGLSPPHSDPAVLRGPHVQSEPPSDSLRYKRTFKHFCWW